MQNAVEAAITQDVTHGVADADPVTYFAAIAIMDVTSNGGVIRRIKT